MKESADSLRDELDKSRQDSSTKLRQALQEKEKLFQLKLSNLQKDFDDYKESSESTISELRDTLRREK